MKLKGLIALASVLALAGCAAPMPNPSSTDDGKLHIVTSTNVWADLVQTIGGDAVVVQSIVSNPNQDPHSYELTPKDQLAISKADFLIGACNASDPFFRQAVGNKGFVCLAENQSVTDNPHVWYSMRKMVDAAFSISGELSNLKPSAKDAFNANYHTFEQQSGAILDTAIQELEKTQVTASYVATESIANELLNDLGLKDLTPLAVAQAGINETDLSPIELKQLQDSLVGSWLFAYNKSQESGQTTFILNWLAEPLPCNDVSSKDLGNDQNVTAIVDCVGKATPVGFYEQLPAGQHYLDWMKDNIHQIMVGLHLEQK
ncbi:MAG: metal ABC transporter solute-binding protein, Zn/Mn family [Micrococcales bacterium]